MKILGYDVGRKRDPSALVMIEGEVLTPRRDILMCRRLPLGMKYNEQAEIVAEVGQQADMVIVDAGGVGDAVHEMVYDRLLDRDVWAVNITGGDKTKINADASTASIPKKVMVGHLEASLEKGHFGGAHTISREYAEDTLALFEEMKYFCRTGVSMQAAAGAHDDLVMACCLALMGFKITELTQRTDDG